MELHEFYSLIHEEERLCSKAAQIEYRTTCRYIDKYLKKGSRILEIGAAFGAYSLAYAKRGYQIDAIDYMPEHIMGLKKQITSKMQIHAAVGNALDLSAYEDETFDMVLCLGPLYHLHGLAAKLTCIEEAKRVCKKDGVMIFAFISNDACLLTEQFVNGNNHILDSDDFDLVNHHFNDGIFSFLTLAEARKLMRTCHLTTLKEVAADGMSEAFREQINAFDDGYYEKWIQYHFQICEKPEMLGYSNHILLITQK